MNEDENCCHCRCGCNKNRGGGLYNESDLPAPGEGFVYLVGAVLFGLLIFCPSLITLGAFVAFLLVYFIVITLSGICKK